MNEQELKEILKLLEEAGWEPKLCDTSIPYYDNKVMCGQPTDTGDIVYDEYSLPRDFLKMQPEFVVTAQGNSMKGVDIADGDRVRITARQNFKDGDIVLAMIDGEYTLKTYCEDEDGRPWLLPQNEEYEAFPLPEGDNTRILGVVSEIMKGTPRVSYRSCIKIINKAKARVAERRRINSNDRARTIRNVAPMVKMARQWYAVYRAMVDAEAVRSGDFQGFCELVRDEVPRHDHLPVYDELQRLCVQSFSKPVKYWDAQNAPVTGKRFEAYLSLAQLTQQELEP